MGDAAPFEVVLVHLDGYLRVKLRGELDHQAVTSEVAESLREMTDIRDRVVLDLSEVTFLDSSGMAILASIGRQHDGPLRIEGAPSGMRRKLEIIGLGQFFEFGEITGS